MNVNVPSGGNPDRMRILIAEDTATGRRRAR